MNESTDFDRDAAARVLRRALELAERDSSVPWIDAVSEQALVEAAEELGVDPYAVRRAAAEERLGVLGGTPNPLDPVVGPASVGASRVVEQPADALMDLVDSWLRRSGTLRRRRMDPGGLVAVYARRSDLIAGVQRTARVVRGEEHLGRVRRLQVVVQPVDATRSVVALVADLELERTVAVAGGSSVAGVGSTLAAIEAVTVTPWLWMGVPASLVAGVGVLRWRAHGLADVEVELQGVLDRALAQEPSSGVLADVRERLLGGRSRQRRTA